MSQGKLYIVATPIGNLNDITFRAVETLKNVDLILCENKSVSARILNHFSIQTPLQTLFQTQENKLDWITEKIKQGKSIAYISDAGTPGLSDPGANIVRICRKESIPIVPIPGVSALATILSVSGMQANPTLFLGFLSEKKNRKRKELEEYKNLEAVLVIYESVYKLPDTLSAIHEIYPESEVLIGRELTKLHEELILVKSTEIPSLKFVQKGEFVILINNHLKKIAKADRQPTDIDYREVE